MSEIFSNGFKVIFTCSKRLWFDVEWVGRGLDKDYLKYLKTLNEPYGVDLCGENGEYHTIVIDG